LRWALVSLDGVAPSRMVSVSASVNPPLHHKVQKLSSGTGSPGWSRKKGRKTVVWWLVDKCLLSIQWLVKKLTTSIDEVILIHEKSASVFCLVCVGVFLPESIWKRAVSSVHVCSEQIEAHSVHV